MMADRGRMRSRNGTRSGASAGGGAIRNRSSLTAKNRPYAPSTTATTFRARSGLATTKTLATSRTRARTALHAVDSGVRVIVPHTRRAGAVTSTSPTVDAADASTIAPTPTPRNHPRRPPRKFSHTASTAFRVTSSSKWPSSNERPITSAISPTAQAIATAAEAATTPRRRSGATATDPPRRTSPSTGRNSPRKRTSSAVRTVAIAKSLFVSSMRRGWRSFGIRLAVFGEIDFTASITNAPTSAMLRIS
jgi:hypothetical protein